MVSMAKKSTQNLFRPCIDLHEGAVKQLVGSTLHPPKNSAPNKKTATVKTNFIAAHPPIYYADIFNTYDLIGGHIIMLDGHNYHTKEPTHLRKQKSSVEHPTVTACSSILAKYPELYHIGGGMTLDNAVLWLERGARKLIFTSALFSENKFSLPKLQALAKLIGKERIVIDMSSRPVSNNPNLYQVMIKGWREASDLFLTEETFAMLSRYASEFLIHAVAREGLSRGIDEKLIALLARYAQIPSVYAGSLCKVADIELIRHVGRGRIYFTVGSALALYGGKLRLETILQHGSISYKST
ncbi:phosphoribosylformimino-5-aminoimidazole carboxamide ribotide isomerase [Spirochaetota bacterium]|nr:phosphoribosylformimino-5-aminoimidazole carboxamide ribotide isomerase [Spirochaetota bacterium]